jgi:molybdate transport system substrate-binding protein
VVSSPISSTLEDPSLSVAEIARHIEVAPSTLYGCSPAGRNDIRTPWRNLIAPERNQGNGMSWMNVQALLHWTGCAALLAATLICPAAAQEVVTVFAAASLKNALEEAAQSFSTTSSTPVRFSFAASSALARQIEQGAPADLFASADREWMDYLSERNLIQSATCVDLLGNRLVVIAPAESAIRDLALTADAFRLAAGQGRIAMGEVSAVPAGRYAKAALDKLGLWSEVRPRIAQTENVRAALLLVSRGEAPLGIVIVYETDAKADPKVRVVAVFPPDSHPPIVYPFAVTRTAKGDGAARFLSFLQSPQGHAFFEAQGFTVLARAAVQS